MQGEHATRGIPADIRQDKVISVVVALALALALALGITRRIFNQTRNVPWRGFRKLAACEVG